MKKIFLIALTAVMIFTACSSNKAIHDFVSVDFGMSTIEVIDAFGEPDKSSSIEDGMLFYYDKTVFGVANTHVAYTIKENGLAFVFCAYLNQYADLKSYQQEADIIKQNMIIAYGEPKTQNENSWIWENYDNSNPDAGWRSITLSLPTEESKYIAITIL